MLSLSLKQKKLKFVLFVFLIVFYFPLHTQASMGPGVFIMDLKINGVENNEIKGDFIIWNSEEYYLPDLNYEIKLFKGTEFEKLQLIDTEVSQETFFVAPNQKITKSFSYQYPKNIASGDYTLRVQTIDARGSELGWKDGVVSLKGENKFLDILSIFSRVLIGKEEASSLTGINATPEENVVAFLKVQNPGDEITVVPKIKIFKRMFNMPLVREYQEAPITLAKGETKEINFAMPKLDVPESYLAEVKFYQNNEQVSGIEYFRWVIKGEGGKILYIKTDKDYYKAGEKVEVTVDSVGPADLSNIGEGKLEITVYDKDGNTVSEASKNVTLSFGVLSSMITIPVGKDLLSPKIEVKLTKNGNVLDDRTIGLPVFSDGAKALKKEMQENMIEKYLLYSMPILLIILIIGFLFYRFKTKRQK